MTFPSGERPLSRLEVFWEMWSGWSESTTWPGADDMKPLFKHVAASSSSESTLHLARPCTSCEGEAHQVSKRGVEVGPGLGHIKSSAATTIHCLTYWIIRVKSEWQSVRRTWSCCIGAMLDTVTLVTFSLPSRLRLAYCTASGKPPCNTTLIMTITSCGI